MSSGSRRPVRATVLPASGASGRIPLVRLRPVALGLALLPFLAWASACDARAHGTGSRLLPPETPLCAVLFHYSTGDPMSWTGVSVFAPDGSEWVRARTDAAGVAVFAPDRPGTWRVQARDEEGHLAEAEVAVGQDAVRSQPAGDGPGALWPRALLGVSLLANAFLALALRRARRG